MYYSQMRKYDIANGPSIRCTLFVSGCTHNCEGCFNKDYSNFTYGTKWDDKSQDIFMTYVNEPNVKGITILGGEPFQQTKDNSLLNLLKLIKDNTDKSIWIYSGYTYEEIISNVKMLEILKLCDVLVDGKFDHNKTDYRLKFRGSSNQRIIDVQQSLKYLDIILCEEYN